jgi:hypothetical protein
LIFHDLSDFWVVTPSEQGARQAERAHGGLREADWGLREADWELREADWGRATPIGLREAD